jgi:hypothetical protein
MKQALTLSLILILVIATASFLVTQTATTNLPDTIPYVGVTFTGNTTAEAKLLIDRVKTYTNIFILGAAPTRSANETITNEICNYAVSQGLNIMVNFGYYDPAPVKPENLWHNWTWQFEWLATAKQRYGNQFLGVYYGDEPGGVQLDYNWTEFFTRYGRYLVGRQQDGPLFQIFADWMDNPDTTTRQNYDTEANWFNISLQTNSGRNYLKRENITTFTSDYALYWFDYLGGYDTLLAQFGSNDSVLQNVALIKGAARMQNKPWGAIITWKYDQPPYLDTGEEIYNQMRMAYEAGAQYIIIFNYPQIEGNPYGVMTDEHFEALERFWEDLTTTPSTRTITDLSQTEVALVLPKNYGWGMRRIDDRIWGFWGPDQKSAQVWDVTSKLLSQYDLRLDIVYDDPVFPITDKYSQIYYWNQTV